MKTGALLPSLLLAAGISLAAPTTSKSPTDGNVPDQAPGKSPWSVYSLREQPFSDAELTFQFLDTNDHYETKCRTGLPMNGYATCEDGTTTFIYGGNSYQYGETWLSIQRTNIDDCSAGQGKGDKADEADKGKEEDEDRNDKSACKKRSATGTLNLPSDFWQQPGWNSWVHPENLDMKWSWSS